MLCISALRTLLRPGIRVRRGRRRSGNAHGHNRARWNILTAVKIHALFLSARSQTVPANLYTGGRNNHQPPARINRRNLYRRGVSRIRQLVGIPHRVITRPERERNRVMIIFLVDRSLHDRHSRRPGSGHLLKLALFRQCEIKSAVAPEVSYRRLRLVLYLVFFADIQRRAVWLKNHHVRRYVDRFRVLGRLINIHLRGGRARRNGVVEINAVIHCADEHRLRTKSGMVEREFPVRSALRVRYLLHPSLKLDQDELDSRGCFAGRAVLHRAANRPGLGYRQRSQNECAEQSQSHGVGAPHCALPSAGRVPRGRRTCASVT